MAPAHGHGVSLDLSKRLWASGFDAKFNPVPEQPDQGQWLVWTPEAEAIFAKHYRAVHFPQDCAKQAGSAGYLSARTDMEWGVTSVVRDVQDQLLYGLLRRQFVAFSRSVADQKNIQDAMRQYREQCQGSGIWMEDCYFEKLTGCTEDYLAGRLPMESERLERRVPKVTAEPAWFMQMSQEIWDEMVQAKAVRLHDSRKGDQPVGGDAADDKISLLGVEDAGLQAQGVQRRAAQRLAMFRALLLKVAFKPNAALQAAINGVERRTKLAQLASSGPLTVVHIRRTDKAKDFAGGSQTDEERAAFETAATGRLEASLGTFSDTLLPWLESAKGPISSLFVMSDDWHVFQPQVLKVLTRKLQTPPEHVIYDPMSQALEPKDEKTLLLGNEAWGHKAMLGRYILAVSFALGKWADNIVGCGSSGVTQLASQLIGGRLRMDPNSLGLWEDDSVDLEAARAWQPITLLAVRSQVNESSSFWATVGRAMSGFFGSFLK